MRNLRSTAASLAACLTLLFTLLPAVTSAAELEEVLTDPSTAENAP